MTDGCRSARCGRTGRLLDGKPYRGDGDRSGGEGAIRFEQEGAP
ncbi:hypothetical protein [Streptomyces sp. NPDC046371]